MSFVAVWSARIVVGGLLLFAGVALGFAGDWERAAARDGGRAVAISVGGGHACALLESGAIECWGRSQFGQADAPSGRFSAVSVGTFYTCGLRESGEVECWGYTFDGQARPAAGKYVQISSGAYRACALSEAGAVSCWMMYNGAADVPAWLRGGGLPSTGTGGVLGRGDGAWRGGVLALVSLGGLLLSLLVWSVLGRGGGGGVHW